MYKSFAVQVERILKNEWNPIGIDDEKALNSEYSGYVAPICKMIIDGRNEFEIASYLNRLAQEEMGLSPDPHKGLEIARMLVSLRQN